MKRAVYWILVTLLIATTGPASADPEKIECNLDEQKLAAGDIQTFINEYKTDGKGIKKRAVGVVLLNAPPDTVWEVLEDWSGIADSLPALDYAKPVHVSKSNVDDHEISISLIVSRLKVLFLNIDYSLEVKMDKTNYRQDWLLITGDQVEMYNKKNIPIKKPAMGLKNIEGFEYIEPYADGTKTIYYYAPIIETSIPIPTFIEIALQKKILTDYMKVIRKKVNTLVSTGRVVTNYFLGTTFLETRHLIEI